MKSSAIFVVLVITLSFSTIAVSAQDSKIETLKKKDLSYYWIGRTCPAFRNPEERFGFKIECAGCIRTPKIQRNNRRVVKAINSVYGKNWFEENKKYL